MINRLTMNVKNFGPIQNANICLKKLNIIAGINGSGKTTSSKLLYCFLISNSKESNYLANKSINDRYDALINEIKYESDESEVINQLANNKNLTNPNYSKIFILFLKPNQF